MEALQVLIPESILPAPTVSENATVHRILTHSTKPLTKPLHVWSLEASCKLVKGGPMSYKPDLVLQEEPSQLRPKPEFLWKDVVSFLELSSTPYSNSGSTSTVRNNVMCKVYAIFVSQPGQRFFFTISIAHQEFHTHMFDRSGVVHSQPYNIHQFPRTLLCILALLVFCKPKQVGYDPTIIYSHHIRRRTPGAAQSRLAP